MQSLTFVKSFEPVKYRLIKYANTSRYLASVNSQVIPDSPQLTTVYFS